MRPSKEEKLDDLVYPEYWDERYADSDGTQPTHEWFKTYESLEPFFEKRLFSRTYESDPRILHLGSGDSTVPYDLRDREYRNQICIDFSPTVVKLMTTRSPDVKWFHGDVRHMPCIATASVDLAFDKGTLDAMIYGSVWDHPDEVKENARQYMAEVDRVLKDTGVFIWITFRQPMQYKALVNQNSLWDLETEVLSGGPDTFDYYAYIMTKTSTSPGTTESGQKDDMQSNRLVDQRSDESQPQRDPMTELPLELVEAK